MPSRARWQALLTQSRLALETVRDELQAYHDDRSDAWHEGERAAVFLDDLAALEAILDALSGVLSG